MTAFSEDPDSLDGALAAAKNGQQSEWIQAHLQLPYNRNSGLAKGLQLLATRAYLGPIQLPLDDLKRVCGPEPDIQFPEDPQRWEERITFLTQKLEAGWVSPPFIVAGGMELPLYLADGNHRLEAMRRLGTASYWAVLYFEDNSAKQQFLDKYPNLNTPL